MVSLCQTDNPQGPIKKAPGVSAISQVLFKGIPEPPFIGFFCFGGFFPVLVDLEVASAGVDKRIPCLGPADYPFII